jgi:hypothetical protein
LKTLGCPLRNATSSLKHAPPSPAGVTESRLEAWQQALLRSRLSTSPGAAPTEIPIELNCAGEAGCKIVCLQEAWTMPFAFCTREKQVCACRAVTYSDGKAANRNDWDFGWEIAHAAVSRRPPISLDRMVALHPVIHARRRSLGFVHRSRAIFCRPAPNPNRSDSHLFASLYVTHQPRHERAGSGASSPSQRRRARRPSSCSSWRASGAWWW